jgi:hypothetical protein
MKAQRMLEVHDGPSDPFRGEAEDPLRGPGEALDGEIGTQQDERDVDVGQKIGEVVVGAAQDLIRPSDLLGRSEQLFVGGLKLFLGGLEFLIDALQLLIAGKKLLVGGLEPRVGRLLLLDDGLEVLARDRQILLELDDAAAVLPAPRLGDGTLD